MRLLLILPFCLLFLAGRGQQHKELSLSLTNSNSDFPFSRFGSLFKGPVHPGMEMGYGFNWRTRVKHDLFQQVRLGYFYHRFLQHGIPLYSNFGYRRKFNEHLFAESSIGLGYLHSVPATAKLKLNSSGDYENNKGVGRGQGMAVFNISGGYNFKLRQSVAAAVFINYQQRIQTPFINSYVPMLPYNTFMMGFKKSLPAK